ncbi:hypothetical protein [Companilactobacillus bobalius]|uniref:Uncharacterized protein n=2 Tax=Companilactobacillus bobalius TaxID=2801451 RepID=A0A202F7U8_9LACO|nr:hypothetical protein [Companilactobacillus bobalius]KRK83486.1 hypothetical protein FC78_GL001442 [Companilactobacillus bobalius DSM 19674]OVE96569.1 hypothetical protein LKACC16343_02238 [Companilactobacillus bobalius]GEO58456.1 hypothetical protein LBO01_15850 [Companilactobacillus paralimentarius]
MMNLYIRKADLAVGNILVVINQNKETIFIASRDKKNPFLIKLYNRLNTLIGEIKLKNNFLKIYSIEINGEEKATINAIPMLDLKYVHLSKINWNVTGNLVISDYHVTKDGKEILCVQPTILAQGHPGLELDFANMDDGPIGTLLTIFLNKYIKLPTLTPNADLDNNLLKNKIPYLNNFKSKCN